MYEGITGALRKRCDGKNQRTRRRTEGTANGSRTALRDQKNDGQRKEKEGRKNIKAGKENETKEQREKKGN